ncbi:MAG: hypothetical protein ACPG31_08080 [Planctomycetota bacterium]
MSHAPHSHIPESLEQQLQADWEQTYQAFQDFLQVPERLRFQHLGSLFEVLYPWIERGVRSLTVRHFILLPTEMAVARLFAKTCRRESLPKSHVIFQIWVESSLLRDVANPKDELGSTNGAAGEPSARLQHRFNRLPYADRALLYLYMVERCSVREVSGYTGIPQAYAVESLGRIWARVQEGLSERDVPRGWRSPQLDEQGCVRENGQEGNA